MFIKQYLDDPTFPPPFLNFPPNFLMTKPEFKGPFIPVVSH